MPPDAPPFPDPGPRRRILVVDDEPLNVLALSTLLTQAGYAVVTAVDGAAALAVLTGLEAVDGVLLDLGLPIISGFSVLGWMASSRLPVPVVVISGDGDPATRRRCEALGCHGYLEKPCSPEILLSLLAALPSPASLHNQ